MSASEDDDDFASEELISELAKFTKHYSVLDQYTSLNGAVLLACSKIRGHVVVASPQSVDSAQAEVFVVNWAALEDVVQENNEEEIELEAEFTKVSLLLDGKFSGRVVRKVAFSLSEEYFAWVTNCGFAIYKANDILEMKEMVKPVFTKELESKSDADLAFCWTVNDEFVFVSNHILHHGKVGPLNSSFSVNELLHVGKIVSYDVDSARKTLHCISELNESSFNLSEVSFANGVFEVVNRHTIAVNATLDSKSVCLHFMQKGLLAISLSKQIYLWDLESQTFGSASPTDDISPSLLNLSSNAYLLTCSTTIQGLAKIDKKWSHTVSDVDTNAVFDSYLAYPLGFGVFDGSSGRKVLSLFMKFESDEDAKFSLQLLIFAASDNLDVIGWQEIDFEPFKYTQLESPALAQTSTAVAKPFPKEGVIEEKKSLKSELEKALEIAHVQKDFVFKNDRAIHAKFPVSSLNSSLNSFDFESKQSLGDDVVEEFDDKSHAAFNSLSLEVSEDIKPKEESCEMLNAQISRILHDLESKYASKPYRFPDLKDLLLNAKRTIHFCTYLNEKLANIERCDDVYKERFVNECVSIKKTIDGGIVQLEQVINHANDPISAASIIEEARKAIAETETALEAIKKEISSHRSKIEAANKNQSVSISSQGQVSKFKNAIAKAALNAENYRLRKASAKNALLSIERTSLEKAPQTTIKPLGSITAESKSSSAKAKSQIGGDEAKTAAPSQFKVEIPASNFGKFSTSAASSFSSASTPAPQKLTSIPYPGKSVPDLSKASIPSTTSKAAASHKPASAAPYPGMNVPDLSKASLPSASSKPSAASKPSAPYPGLSFPDLSKASVPAAGEKPASKPSAAAYPSLSVPDLSKASVPTPTASADKSAAAAKPFSNMSFGGSSSTSSFSSMSFGGGFNTSSSTSSSLFGGAAGTASASSFSSMSFGGGFNTSSSSSSSSLFGGATGTSSSFNLSFGGSTNNK